MRRTMIVAAATVIAFAAPLAAQQAAAPPAATQDDTATVDSAVAALYSVISGPAGPRDWARFKALFAADGRMVQLGKTGPLMLSPQGYVDLASVAFGKEGFFEQEIARRTERYGNLVHVFSTYESRRTADGAPFARGINSIQFARIDGKWRIMSIMWQSETPAFPLPDAYLPTTPATKEK